MFNNENRRFSLRKLSVGLASVCIGITFISVKQDTVKADTIDAKTNIVTAQSVNPDVQKADTQKELLKNTDTQDGVKQTEPIDKTSDSNIPRDLGTNGVAKENIENNVDNIDAKRQNELHVSTGDNQLHSTPENKQALETSLLKDTTKPETTNTFYVRKSNIQANVHALRESKAVDLNTNGGFDSSWGTLDVNDWKGNVQGDYYQLTDYTGDTNHVIVPNEADFAKAGISTSGKQVGVTSSLMHTIFKHNSAHTNVTIAFSKTDNKMVKAIDSNWFGTWNPYDNFVSISATLSKFDGTNLDVSNVTNMSQMFYGSQISDLSSLANWKVDNVTDMSSMFQLNNISDLSSLANWKVDNVTDMSSMFYGNQISDISSLASWKVNNVTDMSSMFEQNQISDISSLANWKVDNVTDMSSMFEQNQISDISSLANWKVDNVTDMKSMFEQNQISDISSLANWKVDNVTNMSQMFEQNQISDISSLANWKVDNVTNMSQMFEQNQISDISPLANWKVDNVTDMKSMFEQNQISDISPLANWKVDNVTNMSQMFEQNQISDISPLANWTVDNVRDMGFMFTRNQISDISPLTNWNVNNVVVLFGTFDENQISDLSPLANWKVDNVTDMSSMFYGNHISDLSPLVNWNVNSVDYMYSMFDNNLSVITQAKRVINFVYPAGYTGKKQDSVTQTVDLPQKVKIELTTKDSKPSNNILDWVTKTETPEAPDPVYFQDYTVPEIKGLLEPDKTVITREQADITKPINVTVTYKLVDSNTNDAFALDSKNGLHEHANVNDNGGYDEDYWGKINVDDWNYTVNGDTITINGLKDGVSTGANDAVIVPNLDDFKLAGKDGGAKTVYISRYTLGKTAKHKYYGLSKTNGNTFATDSSLNSAFEYTSNLTHADLNSLNTGNVTDMSNMFNGASSLHSLDVSNWDTSKVTDMSSIFKFNDNGASSLTSLDVSNWDTSNVTNMNGMFNNASSLTSLDVSNWNTSKVTDMSYMFSNADNLTSLDVSKWDTSNVTDMHNMFEDTYSLTSLDVSKWNTGNVTDMSYMFEDSHSLTSLNVSHWDTSNVTNMNGMFNNARSLTSLDVLNWNTSNVTNMNGMFDDADNLTDLDVSHWDTGKVTDMSWMFSDVSRLTSLDVSNWDTGKVTDMSWMFYGASSLKNLDVSNWDTGNVTNMINMFRSASSLTSLDVSKWDTRNVTYMNLMFNNASSLTGLDVSKWNTGKVTYMNGMFADASSLTSLDVSKWDTSNVTYMIEMFSNDPNLALIVNSGKFADYLVNHDSFAMSTVDSDVKSVTTDNTKLLKLLTSDVGESKSATRTIVFTFPTGYSPDLNKYHLTKNGNTYQIKQSADYDKSYVQGTVLINATYDIAYHHIDTTKPYKLSWQPNYDKLVLAHKNADGSVSFDAIQLPKVPGYKTIVKTVANPVNPTRALFAVSFMALPKPVIPVQNDVKPVKTVTLATPVAIEVAKPIKIEPKVATTPKTINLSNDAVSTTPKETTWQVANNLEHDTYHVSNGKYTVELPYISNAQLYVIANDSTKDSVLFTYKGQNTKYVFNIKFVNGHYLLTTYEIKSDKLVKLIDYNFIKSSKMIDVILDWLKR